MGLGCTRPGLPATRAASTTAARRPPVTCHLPPICHLSPVTCDLHRLLARLISLQCDARHRSACLRTLA